MVTKQLPNRIVLLKNYIDEFGDPDTHGHGHERCMKNGQVCIRIPGKMEWLMLPFKLPRAVLQGVVASRVVTAAAGFSVLLVAARACVWGVGVKSCRPPLMLARVGVMPSVSS